MCRNNNRLSGSRPSIKGRDDSQLKYIIENYISKNGDTNVCDYGCGNAPFLETLSQYPPKIINSYLPVDIDKKALKNAVNLMHKHKEQIRNKSFDACKPLMEELKRYRGRIDIVLIHHVIHEVISIDEMLKQVFMLIAPEGTIFIGDFTSFFSYEPTGILWDCDMIKGLFSHDIFDVKCIPFDEERLDVLDEFISAVISLKKDKNPPKSIDLLPRIKDVFQKKKQEYEKKLSKKSGHYEEEPEDVKLYKGQIQNLGLQLDKLQNVPELKLVEDVERLIAKLRVGYSDWYKSVSYIHQEGKFAESVIISPNEFMELSVLERLEKNAGKEGEEYREVKQRFRKTASGPLLEVIERPGNKRLVILGDPGMGKTTTLKYLIYYYAENFRDHRIVPVYEELKYYAEKKDWLVKEIKAFLKGIDIKELSAHFKVVLLLDGYNEMTGEKSKSLDSEINSLLKIDNSQIIITSRKSEYPERFEDFNTCEIKQLDDTKIENYLNKIFKGNYKQVFNDINNKGLLELARIPLFLKFICDLLQRLESLPDTKGRLLKRMIEVKFLHGHEKKHKYIFHVPEDLIIVLLSEFCHGILKDNKGIAFERKDLHMFLIGKSIWIKQNYGSLPAEMILHEIMLHGFVQGHAGMLSFWHQTILEYLAANYLKDYFESIKDKKGLCKSFNSYFRYKKWDEILSIFFGLISGDIKEKILSQFHIRPDSDDFRKISLLLDISKISMTPDPCTTLLKSKDSYIRLSVADALGKIKPEKAIEILIDLLKDEDPDARLSATMALEKIKSEKAITPLIDLLKNKNSYERWMAVDTLGKIKPEKAIEVLIDLLKDEDIDIRRRAVRALGEIKSEKAIEILIDLLKDKDSYIRLSVADALGKIKSEKAIETLIDLLKDEDIGIRRRAVRALGKIKSEKATEILIDLLKDKNSYIRLSAAKDLGKIKPEKAVETLVDLLKDEDPDARFGAAFTLVEIKPEKAVETLIDLLKDEDPDARLSVAEALGKIKPEMAIETLIDLLKDEDPVIRFGAAYNLVEINPENAMPLIDLLKDKDSYARWRAAEALGKIKPEMAVETLIDLLKDKDSVLNAVLALGKIIDELKEEGKLNVLNKVVKSGFNNLIFFKNLKTIRYIPEDIVPE